MESRKAPKPISARGLPVGFLAIILDRVFVSSTQLRRLIQLPTLLSKGQAFIEGSAKGEIEATCIVDLALGIAKRRFIEIEQQIERDDGNVSALDAPLQERPEVFDPVRPYDTSLNVTLRVI